MLFGGLSNDEVEKKRLVCGFNETKIKKKSVFLRIGKWLISPISLMLILTAIISFAIGKDFDGWFITFLLFLNMTISIWQERKADKAIEKLSEHLLVSVRVLRMGFG